MTVTIATWNVNSIKSRLQHLLECLQEDAYDVLLLQETKCINDNFPRLEIEDAGYNVAIHGQKTYNGVAILSKYPIEDVVTTLPGDDSDEQARYIEGVISLPGEALRVASVYVPNGQSPDSEKFQYKLSFFNRLQSYVNVLLEYDEKLVIGGDYNVGPTALDVYDADKLDGTTCYHRDEREAFRRLLNLGLTDAYRTINPNTAGFSWWDYRAGAWQKDHGMRIDHLLLSPEAADALQAADVNRTPRQKEKPSDHTPVWCRLEGS